MKRLLALLAASFPLLADVTVRASGGDYPATTAGLQAAINYVAANCGDVILYDPVTITSTITIPRTSRPCWKTIRGHQSRLLPRGYRPSYDAATAAADSRLMEISFDLSTSVFAFEADPSFTRICWVSSVAGNTVTIGADASPANPCSVRTPDGTTLTFTSPPCTVTFLGVSVPSSGTSGSQGTGLRVGMASDGKCHISHKSDITEGTHFTCTNCVATGERNTAANFNFPEGSVPLTNIGYDTGGNYASRSDRPNWLSGPAAADPSVPGQFNGAESSAYSGPPQGPHHWRFEGIHFRRTGTGDGAYGVLFFKDVSYDYRYVPHHIEWDRCLFSQPKAARHYWRWIGLYHGENLVVRDSSFRNMQSNFESQAVFIAGSQGPLILENIDVDGMTENFLAGGISSIIAGNPEIRVTRSLFRKRWEQWPKLRLVRQASTDTLALTTTDSATRCNAGTCQAAYEDTWYAYSQDSTLVISPGASASIFVGVRSDGTLEVGHNSGANLACSGAFVCTNGVTSRDQMAEYAMLYEWTASSGVWNASASWSWSSYSHKNTFELKMGRHVQIVGNIFRNYWAAGGQASIIGFAVRNQNGQDVSTALDGLYFSRNKVSSGHSGPRLFTVDDAGWNTFGRNLHISHNIILDMNRASYGDTTLGGMGMAVNQLAAAYQSGPVAVTIEHNTVDATRKGVETLSVGTDYRLSVMRIANNLWLWNPYSLQMIGGDSINTWNTVRKEDDTPVGGYGYIHPDSEYLANLNLGTGTIPDTGWGVNWSNLFSENFGCTKGGVCGFTNVRASGVTFSDHFVSVSSPMTCTDNLRLKPTSPYSKHCTSGCTDVPTTTGADPGADVDWVETLTDGVAEGLPELARRWAVKIKREGSTATVRVSNPSTMTLKIGPYQSMKSGDLVVDDSTPDADLGGHKRFDVSGLTAGVVYWYTLSDGTKTVKGRL